MAHIDFYNVTQKCLRLIIDPKSDLYALPFITALFNLNEIILKPVRLCPFLFGDVNLN